MGIYNTGIVTVVSGSTTVSGYGTSWLSEIDIGDVFVKRGAAAPFKVSSVDSNTQLQLNAVYPGPTASGVNYDIFRDFSQNIGLAKIYGSDRTDWPVIIGDNLDKLDHLGLGWRQIPYSCTFVTQSGFYCSGDKSEQFPENTRLKIVHGNGTSYMSVDSASYSAGSDQTTIVTTSGGLQSPISVVYESVVTQGPTGNYPENFDNIVTENLTVTGGFNLPASQDIANLNVSTYLGAQDITVSGLTASRMVVTDGAKGLASADISSFLAGTSQKISVADDGDGTITLTLPSTVDLINLNIQTALRAQAITVSGLTNSLPVFSDGSKALVSKTAQEARAAILPTQTTHSGKYLGTDGLDVSWNNFSSLIDMIYPVGAIYISTLSTNPATLFGFGTWEAFGEGKVLVGLDSGDEDFDTVEETGGAKTHQLTEAEMPAHTHPPPGSRNFITNTEGGTAANVGTGEYLSIDTPVSTGGDGAHNNLQPFVVVYVFKRTA